MAPGGQRWTNKDCRKRYAALYALIAVYIAEVAEVYQCENLGHGQVLAQVQLSYRLRGQRSLPQLQQRLAAFLHRVIDL